jgi:hypothetical protein
MYAPKPIYIFSRDATACNKLLPTFSEKRRVEKGHRDGSLAWQNKKECTGNMERQGSIVQQTGGGLSPPDNQ